MISSGRNMHKLGQLLVGRLVSLNRRHASSTGRYRGEEFSKLNEYLYRHRGEPNPEYHHAPRCFVKNYMKYQTEQLKELKTSSNQQQQLYLRNPRYRWADFRRRMIYGTYDI